MGSINDSAYKAFTATAAALGRNVRVKYDANGNVLVAGATDSGIGTTTEECLASGNVNVQLYGATRFMVASAAITRADKLQGAASGKVATLAAGTALQLQALEAAGADGDIIECAVIDTIA